MLGTLLVGWRTQASRKLGPLPSPLDMTTGGTLSVSFLKEKPRKTLNVGVEELGSAPGLVTDVLGAPPHFPRLSNGFSRRLCGAIGKVSGRSGGQTQCGASRSIPPASVSPHVKWGRDASVCQL